MSAGRRDEDKLATDGAEGQRAKLSTHPRHRGAVELRNRLALPSAQLMCNQTSAPFRPSN